MASADDSFDVARAFMNDTQVNTNTNKRRLVIKDISSHLKRAVSRDEAEAAADFPSHESPVVNCHQTFDYGNTFTDEEKLGVQVLQVLRDHYGSETSEFFERHFNKIMKAIRDPLAKRINTVMVEQVIDKVQELKGAVTAEVGGVNSGTQEVLEEIAVLKKRLDRIERVQREFCVHVAGDLKKIKSALGV